MTRDPMSYVDRGDIADPTLRSLAIGRLKAEPSALSRHAAHTGVVRSAG
jgi:hypothetical protein